MVKHNGLDKVLYIVSVISVLIFFGSLYQSSLDPIAFNLSQRIKFIEGNHKDPIAFSYKTKRLILDKIASLNLIDTQYYFVSKKQRIRNFELGRGNNCSDQCVAMGAILLDNKIDFVVLSMLPKVDALNGAGHTLLQTNFDGQEAAFDVYARRMMKLDDNYVSYPKNWIDNNREIIFFDLNAKTRNLEEAHIKDYYEKIRKSTYVGITPPAEYLKYFNFIDAIYLEIFPERMERFVYNYLAICFNKIPYIYLDNKYEDEIKSEEFQKVNFFGQLMIWSTRFIMLLMSIFIIKSSIKIFTNLK